MKGFIKYSEDQTREALNLIEKINNCLGLPTKDGLSLTWQNGVLAYCSLDKNSGSTIFWGTVVKIDTEQLKDCLTPQQISEIIQLPDDVYICGTNMISGD